MYVKLKKALHGTLQAAVLIWKAQTHTFTCWGFKVNPYDWSVANKTTEGKQHTVLWHVDDIKISHMNKDAA